VEVDAAGAEGSGGLAVAAAEDFAEVGRVGEADLAADCGDGKVGFLEEAGGGFHAGVAEIVAG